MSKKALIAAVALHLSLLNSSVALADVLEISTNEQYLFGVDAITYKEAAVTSGGVSTTVATAGENTGFSTQLQASDSGSNHVFSVTGVRSGIGAVYGGYNYGSSENKDATSNTVNISGSNPIGFVYGGLSENGDASCNTVTISNSCVNDYVLGAFGEEAIGNTVTISGGSVIHGYLCGGLGRESSANNTINLISENGGNVVCCRNVYISAIGGGSTKSTADNPNRGNGTLNVYGSGHSIGGALHANNATLNFYIPASTAGSNIMLKVNGEAHVEDSKIAAYAEVDNIGDFPIVLLRANSLCADNAEFGTGWVADGLLATDMLVEVDNNDIIARLNNQSGVVHVSENAKSPSETQIAGISLINSGSDMIAGRSFGDAAAAVANSGGSGSGSGMAPFASIGGSNIRQHSGSYVDTKGWNIGIGFAKEVRNSKGSLLFGPILEYGRGSYESHLDNSTVGTGDSSFWGIGGIIRQNYDSGLYLEGSVRAGRMQNDYSSDDIGASSQSYDNSAGYYAMHMGVGKVMQVSGRDVVDVYGKLFYTHQNGSSARLTSGHVYDFAAIDSVRSRLGCRYTFGLDDAGSVYAGLAWQHEFGGTADATIRAGSYAVTAPSPGVKGDTGILELGWKTVSANKKLEASLGLEGYAGKQQGIGANASLMWHF